MSHELIFSDRRHAGFTLGQSLLPYRDLDPIVLALPRGGVPVAAEVAKLLGAPLNVVVVRKIGHPFQSELAVGAICEDEKPNWNEAILSRAGLKHEDLNTVVKNEAARIRHQVVAFREGHRLPSLANRLVIVVDDGLATGATMFSAVRYLKEKGATEIVVAIPVAAAAAAKRLRTQVDAVVCLSEPLDLMAISQWYGDFSQVSDEEVIRLLKENQKLNGLRPVTRHLEIPVDSIRLPGDLVTFSSMKALIIFAHGSGSSRRSPRNQAVAKALQKAGFGTLLFDLLTEPEAKNRKNIFNIELLSQRLVAVTKWLHRQPDLGSIRIGYFGASTGAGAALRAASQFLADETVYAIVSRGGRPDLAGDALRLVGVPTLLIVGGEDLDVLALNQQAQQILHRAKVSIVPGASHLFEEPGALEEVSRLAAHWFVDQLEGSEIELPSTHPQPGAAEVWSQGMTST